MDALNNFTVRERFRVKLYLDTNILVYLVDDSYSGVTKAFEYLKQSKFADLLSSRYVIFEFVEVRKREHFFRKVLSSSQKPNVSSLLKYKDDYKSQDIEYISVKDDINTVVFQELESITNDWGIIYHRNILHDDLLAPTFSITLKTRISRHDALMMVSSVWSAVDSRESFMYLLSNDETFVQNCSEADVESILSEYNLKKPFVESLRKLKLANGTTVNLTIALDDDKLATFLPTKLKELIILKNQDYYLGNTIKCGVNFPNDVICFGLVEDKVLNQNIYLTIIGKDLDFVYNTKISLSNFWNQAQIASYPFQSNTQTNISFELKEPDDTGGELKSLPPELLTKIKETGNMIFINPDGLD